MGGGGNNYLDPPSTNPPTPNDYGAPVGSHPKVNGLTVSAATVPEGGQLTLTANGVGIAKPFDGQHANITVTQVTFWIDANGNGVLDQDGQNGGDTIVGTVPGQNLNGDVSLTINPVNLAAWGLQPGTYKFFAIAKSSAGFEGDYWVNSVDIVRDKVKVNGTSDATEEPATDGLVTIEREGPNDFDLTVWFSTSDSDQNGDYTVSPAPASIVIPAGQSQAIVHITPIDDNIVESTDETVELDLEGGEFYDVDSPYSGSLAIHEDTEPTFTVSASPTLTTEGGGDVLFTITRSGEMTGAVTVYYSWGGSAIEGTDYTAPPSNSVVFADNQATQTITASLLDDDGFGESDEDLSMSLEGGDSYVVGSPYSASVTITEDDDYGDSLMLNLPPRETGAAPAAITPAQVRPFLQAAAREWEAAGVDPAALHRLLAGATVRVADLPGSLLGETASGDIYLDDNAAGYGWFLDDRLHHAGDFAASDGAERTAPPGSPAFGRVDLLTAVTHELGHLLGLSDLSPADAPGDVMDLTIGLSTRRVPAPGEGPQSDAHAKRGPSAAAANTTFGGFDADDPPFVSAGQAGANDSSSSAAAARFWHDFGAFDDPAARRLGAVRGIARWGVDAER